MKERIVSMLRTGSRGRHRPGMPSPTSFAAAIACALALAWTGNPADGASARSSDDPDSGAEMIGRPAPEISFDRWIHSKPMTLEQLRGKVVLLRWWTEGCHF